MVTIAGRYKFNYQALRLFRYVFNGFLFQSDRLTLWMPTTHMCVENTVLTFMICLFFNLSYNITITCEWHQLV